jgi:hypothetical protein
MLMLVGHWFENRETSVMGQIPKEIEFGFSTLMYAYRWGDLH